MHSSIKQLVIASHNSGKISEIRSLLSSQNINIIPQSELNVADIEETGTTFVENALLKARNAAKITDQIALADDSGLVVPALGGAPGIYSARYAQNYKDDAKNNQKLLTELQGNDNRQAVFVCVIVLCLSATHPLPIIAEGIWQGEISQQPAGEGGFGYDPLFYVPSHGVTAAELNQSEKNQISHRGLALRALLAKIAALN